MDIRDDENWVIVKQLNPIQLFVDCVDDIFYEKCSSIINKYL